MFPGQGSQYVGMGRELSEVYPETLEVFREANQILKRDIISLCFEGSQEELDKTVNTQVAVFVVNCAYLSILERRNFVPKMVAGHSLGEYSALVAAKVVGFSEALRLVAKRAKLMQESAEKSPGKMIAVLGLEKAKIQDVVESLREKGVINIANYNCPGQIVVSGESSLVEEALKIFVGGGVKRMIELNVGGGFHSSLMEEAKRKFESYLEEVDFSDAEASVVSNSTAKASSSGKELRKALQNQIVNSVLWEDSIKVMVKNGVKSFVEVGPGKVLAGLIKRIAKDREVFPVEDKSALDSFLNLKRASLEAE